MVLNVAIVTRSVFSNGGIRSLRRLNMLISLFILVASLGVLIWSSDVFVDGASATSRHLGISPLIVGMIVVGFGTSAPELLVSMLSAYQGSPGLAIGNALGSNIANIGLILGVTALISPIMVQSGLLRKEMPVLVAVSVIVAGLAADLRISRLDGILMLVVFFGIMFWLLRQSMGSKDDVLSQEAEHLIQDDELPALKPSIVRLMIGLVLLIISSKFLVDSAVAVAQGLGVSDLVIGLTVVAVGTSLPELASSLAAVRRKEHDMALGNVIGSNLFNALAAIGAAGTIAPFGVNGPEAFRDFGVMLVLTALLCLFCIGFKGQQGRINRIEGGVLLSAYAGYLGYLVVSSMP